MKQLKTTLIFITMLYAIPCYGMEAGIIIQQTTIGDRTERSPLNIASDSQIYTEGIGGVTFTYPSNWFTQAPIVQISLQQNSSHPNTLAYVAEVSANSISSTTIMVYQISSGFVTEAPTNSVTVCLFAVDNPL
jgi:hypothetical protein